jgi:hypothetical protein
MRGEGGKGGRGDKWMAGVKDKGWGKTRDFKKQTGKNAMIYKIQSAFSCPPHMSSQPLFVIIIDDITAFKINK